MEDGRRVGREVACGEEDGQDIGEEGREKGVEQERQVEG